uniref:(northern house mosquito) hypothetical protein n=1 Tax=Culex pipiens TaxID=7175 RepID=A0A8D8HS12_CULPI
MTIFFPLRLHHHQTSRHFPLRSAFCPSGHTIGATKMLRGGITTKLLLGTATGLATIPATLPGTDCTGPARQNPTFSTNTTANSTTFTENFILYGCDMEKIVPAKLPPLNSPSIFYWILIRTWVHRDWHVRKRC